MAYKIMKKNSFFLKQVLNFRGCKVLFRHKQRLKTFQQEPRIRKDQNILKYWRSQKNNFQSCTYLLPYYSECQPHKLAWKERSPT